MNNLRLRNFSIFSKLGIFALLAGLTFVSCDTTSSNNANSAPVTLQFQTTTTAAAMTAMAQTKTPPQKTDNKLTIKGSNGTLTITDIHFIVDDFELEKADGKCDEQKGKIEEDCEEFERGLFFVDLPLNNQPLNLTTSSIQDGAYTELEFELTTLILMNKKTRLSNNE